MKDRPAAAYLLSLAPADDTVAVRQRLRFRRLRNAALVLTATAVGTAVLALADPVAPLVAVSASFSNVVASMSDQAQAPSTLASRGTIRLAAAAAAEPTGPNPAEAAGAPSDTMVQKFLAWAHDQDEQERIAAQARQAQAPGAPAVAAQDTPAQVKPDSSAAPARVAEKPQRVAARVRNAHAELPQKRRHHTKIAHAPRAVATPDDHAQAQDAPAQNPQPPSLLQTFGWHD